MRSIEQAKELSDDLWSSVLENVSDSKEGTGQAMLCLNYNNPLARKLTTIQDRALLRNSMQMLYVQALLLGHYSLQSKETDVLNRGLIELINAAVENSSGSGDADESV